ncbi:hypothetical protein J2S55_008310 [Streptosporangium brasiliense]|uniref:Uncharacterized protein n=1 Tax=Streptosporangium brasiliense TaxID=47480 RepID=A0ABT9RJY2_9ACTN|nr:hypothetical protein [Streptosporangium brasiliense]
MIEPTITLRRTVSSTGFTMDSSSRGQSRTPIISMIGTPASAWPAGRPRPHDA